MIFHGFWLVSIVLLVKNTTKLYPGPTRVVQQLLSRADVPYGCPTRTASAALLNVLNCVETEKTVLIYHSTMRPLQPSGLLASLLLRIFD